MGYDTLYDPALDDHQLARVARADGRVLLTRDRQLARRRGVDSLLVESEHLEAQMAQVITHFGLDAARLYSRCPVCNELLVTLEAQVARERVPAYVARTHDAFKLCPGCQRVYWRGSHWQRMEERLAQFMARPKGG